MMFFVKNETNVRYSNDTAQLVEIFFSKPAWVYPSITIEQ